MENAGQRLCKYREHLKLTQYEFSRLYGIKQQSLSKYENGHLSIPDDLKIKLLQKGVNLNWLLTGTGSMFLEQPENTHSSNVPVRTREEERIKQLENELDSLKKNIIYKTCRRSVMSLLVRTKSSILNSVFGCKS